MARIERFPSIVSPGAGRVAVLGSFDGVHLGHQKLIAEAAARGKADLLEPVVITFHPHPSEVLGRVSRLLRITTFRQSIKLLSGLGVRLIYAVRFTRAISELSAAQFLDEVLIKNLSVRHLMIGPDAAVGRRREGDAAFIKRHMESRGGKVSIVDFLADNAGKVSSRKIRQAIQAGDLEDAASGLGRKFEVEGRVRRGDMRGRAIGFPTANLILGRQISPPHGVYKTESILRGKVYRSITNVGVRPTFNGREPTVETHILGWTGGEFYRERLSVRFIKKIRDERKFPGIAELQAQIRRDIVEAEKV